MALSSNTKMILGASFFIVFGLIFLPAGINAKSDMDRLRKDNTVDTFSIVDLKKVTTSKGPDYFAPVVNVRGALLVPSEDGNYHNLKVGDQVRVYYTTEGKVAAQLANKSTGQLVSTGAYGLFIFNLVCIAIGVIGLIALLVTRDKKKY